MKEGIMSQEDYNRIVWNVWNERAKAIVNGKSGGCEHFAGKELSGHCLCSAKNNRGTIIQDGGFKRCSILCCPEGREIQLAVKAELKRRAEDREKERLRVENSAAAQKPKIQIKRKVIDLTPFISPDSLAYS
jgi:hypothetical protein